MQRGVPLRPALAACLASVVAVSTTACVPAYRPPAANEPHAVLKLRRTYEHVAGKTLREAVDVDEHRAYEQTTPAGVGAAPLTDAVLVHPIPATVRVAARFFHTESRMVQETYTVQTPHSAMESYGCSTGFGSNVHYSTCTRMATHYTTETRQRTVNKVVEVPDGTCEDSVRFSPAESHVYLIQYTYQDDRACHVACTEQIPTSADGRFQSAPCPTPSPAP
jgi:hypothetical protein